MKNIITAIALTFTTLAVTAQEDAKSKKILSDLSSATKAYKTISADFTSVLENKQADLKVTQSGKLFLKDTKYSLDLEDFKVINDGTTTWTIAKEDEEVIIENTADLMDENGIDPSTVFSIWEEGFRHKYEGQQMVGTINCDVIKLFPLDPKSRNYHTLVLYVINGKNEVKKIKVFGKSGEEYTYLVDNFNGNASVNDSEFTFSGKSKYTVIDNR
jgi:outer membrane lipoprotein-sorting protein